jgi:hypothetical protein
MEDNDVYPNDGSAFSVMNEPVKQKEARSKEKAKVLPAIPMLEEIIAHFQEQIEVLGDITSIPRQTMLDKDQVLVVLNANDISRRFLIAQKGWLEDLIDDYTKN